MIIIVPRNSATQFGLDILFEITSNYPNKFWQQKSQGYPIYPIYVIRFSSPEDNPFRRPVPAICDELLIFLTSQMPVKYMVDLLLFIGRFAISS